LKIYDVSMTIENQMQVYKNKDDKRPNIETTRDFETSSAMESKITMDMHTGTHLDMPLHFVEGGNSLETLDLNRVFTKCRVLDFTHINDKITRNDLEDKEFKGNSFILLKTKNSLIDDFDFKFIYLAEDGAKYLKEKNIYGVGIDSLGIERDQPEYGTHKTLLEAKIIIIEGLRLKDISEGDYTLVALPLKIKGVEAAPLRAVLIEDI